MNPVSIILLLLIIAYCVFIIYKQVQKKKQGGCGGNCAIFIGLYLIGVIGYQLYKLIRKLLNK